MCTHERRLSPGFVLLLALSSPLLRTTYTSVQYGIVYVDGVAANELPTLVVKVKACLFTVCDHEAPRGGTSSRQAKQASCRIIQRHPPSSFVPGFNPAIIVR